MASNNNDRGSGGNNRQTMVVRPQNCVICVQQLFSTGQRVVMVRGCNHILHKSCLERSFRIRTQHQAITDSNAPLRRCPACPPQSPLVGLIEQLSFPEVASLFDNNANLQGISTIQAQKVVQYLLWCSASNMTGNLELILDKLRTYLLPTNRFPVVRDSGMIQACINIIKENPNDGRVILLTMRLLKDCCWEVGHQGEAFTIVRNNSEGLFEVLLGETALMVENLHEDSMPFIDEVSDESGMDWPESVVRFNRIIPGVVATMKSHPDSKTVQEGGCAFLNSACHTNDCHQTLIESGALPVLYEAQLKYQLEEADEALGCLLGLNLRLQVA